MLSFERLTQCNCCAVFVWSQRRIAFEQSRAKREMADNAVSKSVNDQCKHHVVEEMERWLCPESGIIYPLSCSIYLAGMLPSRTALD